jgi:dTDP-4-amino-4,6-dideoxygalactose transaminase
MTSTHSKIWLSSPHMGGAEHAFVADAFATNWIAPLGPLVDGFEQDICDFTGAKHAAALSSGTSAIHLALILAGTQAGDEVICQSFTFSASANPITYQGAKPVFVDSEPETWNMSPLALEEAIVARRKAGARIAAVIVVHLYGMPAKLDEISNICKREGIPLIEDAAEALGSTYNGKACGTLGDFGVLSFNGNKIITTSGGGALLASDEATIKKARFLATQARDPAPHYQHSHIGYNYRLSNVLAGIGRGQMEVLPKRIDQRRANYQFYKDRFGAIPGITFLEESQGSFCNRWLTCVIVDHALTGGVSREDIRHHLDADNIESRPLWKPMHLQPIFAEAPYFGDRTSETLFDQGLCLPSGSNLTEHDLERVATRFEEALAVSNVSR